MAKSKKQKAHALRKELIKASLEREQEWKPETIKEDLAAFSDRYLKKAGKSNPRATHLTNIFRGLNGLIASQFGRTAPKTRLALQEYKDRYVFCSGVAIMVKTFGKRKTVKAFNTYQQMSLLRSNRIKYVQIIRKTIRGKKVYYLQIVCEGTPPAKVNRGQGVVGIDPGISTVAYAASNKVALVDLVPRSITQKEKFLKALDRRIERSRRVNNPTCFNEDGTIKKGSHFKRLSNRALRLVNRRRKAYRSLSEERKKLQGQLINQLVSNASVIKMEELNVKGLQKRAKDLRINPKTNRPFSKKRFGKPIFRAAPSAFREALKTRAVQLGIEIIMISPKEVKPSQYNHISQTFEKKPLSTRIFDLSPECTSLQRDLYSAFLIGHIENNQYQQIELEQDFPAFYQHMRDFLRQTPKTSRLAWYLS